MIWCRPRFWLYYGAVDGDCDMMSMNDDVKVGTIKLGEATASLPAPPSGSRGALLALGLVPIAARRSPPEAESDREMNRRGAEDAENRVIFVRPLCPLCLCGQF